MYVIYSVIGKTKINLFFNVIMKTSGDTFSNCGESMTDISKEQMPPLIQCCETFSSLFTDSFYVLDIRQKQFCYIKPHNLFLCGHSVEEVMKLGYDFYSRIIHPEDLPLWENILRIIPQYLKSRKEKCEEIDYFSCTFRLLHTCSFATHPLSQMVYQRMKPVWMEGELRYLICSVQSSAIKKIGNLCLHNTGKWMCEEYNFVTKRWKPIPLKILTERENTILLLSKQGKSTGEIAHDLCKGQNTIQNQIKALFTKLDVHSMQEAIEVANYYCITQPSPDVEGRTPSTDEKEKKGRRGTFTEDKLERIQEYLNIGKSIRQTAKLGKVSESAIRYWIGKGKLTKMI